MSQEFSALSSKGTAGPLLPSFLSTFLPPSFPGKPSYHPCLVSEAALQTAPLSLSPGSWRQTQRKGTQEPEFRAPDNIDDI